MQRAKLDVTCCVASLLQKLFAMDELKRACFQEEQRTRDNYAAGFGGPSSSATYGKEPLVFQSLLLEGRFRHWEIVVLQNHVMFALIRRAYCVFCGRP